MTDEEIKDTIRLGETSTVQFKLTFNTAEDVANELVAFSNSRGGRVFVGVDDKSGEIVGLVYADIQRIGSLVANAANDRVRPAVFPEVETVSVDGKAVMIISVPKGSDAPYANYKGEVFVKQGPDKRRVSDNNEMLRLYSDSGNFQPDRQPVRGTSENDLDRGLLDEFFRSSLHRGIDDLGMPLTTVLKNLFILDESGAATLGGLMYFGKRPQQFLSAFDMKAVWFFGNSIGGSEYRDSKDIIGTIPRMFEEGMRFIESILHRRQNGQNFNSVGVLEIPEVALREILQNALVHRSWLKPAPIRILIFDDRVEIVSPGALPPSLTVEDIKLGNAFQRNQLIANLCAKTMDYRGLGSGILRALQADSNIEFHNEQSGDQFRVIFRRTIQKGETTQKTTQETDIETQSKENSKEETDIESQSKENSKEKTDIESQSKEKGKEKTDTEAQSKEKGKEKILRILNDNPQVTSAHLQKELGLSRSGIEKILRHLKQSGRIIRVGPDKGGHWEVIE